MTVGSLPVLVREAAAKLARAETAAEVLEARDRAHAAYDAAKSAGRIARAKQAHDEVVTAVYRAQADALEIESAAKRRLADEYDAAQDRGEVRGNGERSFSGPEKVGYADLNLTPKAVHEARYVRDAEVADPGITRRSLDTLLERGEEPTRAAVARMISARPIAPLPSCSPAVEPPVADEALWLWGRLKDFERDGLLRLAPLTILLTMTAPMRADVLRLAPLVAAFLSRLETSVEPA